MPRRASCGTRCLCIGWPMSSSTSRRAGAARQYVLGKVVRLPTNRSSINALTASPGVAVGADSARLPASARWRSAISACRWALAGCKGRQRSGCRASNATASAARFPRPAAPPQAALLGCARTRAHHGPWSGSSTRPINVLHHIITAPSFIASTAIASSPSHRSHDRGAAGLSR